MGQSANANIIPLRSMEEEHVEQISSYLEENNIASVFYEAHRSFVSNINTESASYRLLISVHGGEGIGRVTAILSLPVKVPALRRAAIMEAISHINFNLMHSAVELDPNDGELRIRHMITTGNGPATDELLGHLIQSVVSIAGLYLGPLMAITFGNAEPANVIALAGNAGQALQ